MLHNRLFILALMFNLLACGQDEKPADPTATAAIPTAQYPRSMPASTLGDSRLIGYWETPCEVSASGSRRLTFLLDPSKAVLETQSYRDDQCQKASHTTRFYMTYKATPDSLEGRIWEVHANIQAADRVNAIFNLQTCSLPTVRDDVWYDLTGSGCQLSETQDSVERGEIVMASQYGWNMSQNQLTLDIPGRSGVKFKRKD